MFEIGMVVSRLFYVVFLLVLQNNNITTLITLQSGVEWFTLFGLIKVVPVVQDASVCFKFINNCCVMFQVVFCPKNVRSPKVGLRSFNLFVVCATLFHVAPGRVSVLKC